MKHTGRQGKRSGPAGYRTPSTFLHRKTLFNKLAQAKSVKYSFRKQPQDFGGSGTK